MRKLLSYIKQNKILHARNVCAFKILSTLIFLGPLFLSCSKESIDIPKEIEMLISDLKSTNPDCTCEPYLDQYLWRNETVYVLGYKGPACDWFPVFYDSNGQPFTLESGYTYNTFLQESNFQRTVWRCK